MQAILQALGIPHSALLSIIFGMMIISFPLGAYVFFHSAIGDEITHNYPISYIDSPFVWFFDALPFEVTLGDAFIVLWAAYLILFGVGTFGPRQNFIKTLMPILSFGRDSPYNYMVSALKWFGVLVFATLVVDSIQSIFGISIEPSFSENELTQFFLVSLAPLVEEIAFRVVLIGLPLYAMYYRRSSLGAFVKSLWHPFENLDVIHSRTVFALIITVGVLFGLSHVLLGDAWSSGKFTQAAISGIILGWVYYRYGLLAAILIHWATNYFIFSYLYFVASINGVRVQDAVSHSLLGTLELIFLVSGAISFAFLITSHFYLRSRRILL